MKYVDLRRRIEGNFFRILDVVKLFPDEKDTTIRTQLHRLTKKGFIVPMKRGFYCFDKNKVDELDLAGQLYSPSYVSLETALNYYGVIPDIPMAVSCVTPVTTKKIETSFGNFYYQKIDSQLFFGFFRTPFPIAYKEKALLDYFYLRRVRKTSVDMRLQLNDWDWKRYHTYAAAYPSWVRYIKLP